MCPFFREPGAERVEKLLPGARLSAANFAEVVAKLDDRGDDAAAIASDIAELDLEAVPPDRPQAEATGMLRAATRSAGLPLGDRCCLALAAALGRTVVNTDRAWVGLVPGIAVQAVR